MRNRSGALRANIARYPWYLFFRDSYFWGPVFFLYFSSVVSLSEVLYLEAVYYVGVAAMEVPSGYFSDRFGRRRTLLLSSFSLSVAYLLFFTGDTFLHFAVGQLCLATGFASASGTDTAFHYESLKGLHRDGEYARREGRALRFVLIAGGLSALAGGFLATGHLRWVYGASFVGAAFSFVIVWFMTEPEGVEGVATAPMGHQVHRLLGKAWGPRLRFFTLYSLVLTILLHLPYEFYQPYLERASSLVGTGRSATPAFAGFHLAVTLLLGAWFTRYPGRIRHRCMMRRTLLGGALLQGGLVVAMAFVVHPVVALLLTGRTISRALVTPLVNAELSPLLERHERSTYLSLQSLLGRLCYGGVLLLLPLGARYFDDPFHGALLCASGLAAILIGLLFFTPFPRDETHTCCRDHGSALEGEP